MINVGIVGFGKMGMLHGALLNGSKKAKVIAICEKSLFMRVIFKKVYKEVKCYENLDKMLSENKIDLLVITTPSFNHVESAIAGIKNNCSIFVEKPLSSNLEDASKLNEIAKNNNAKVQVGFCNRFCPSIREGHDFIKKEILGEIESVNAIMYIADVFEEHDGWRYKKELSGGGVLIDFGIHMIDLLYWYFGEVDQLSAKSNRIYSKEVEDEVYADIYFKKGMSVNFSTSWSKAEYRKSFSKIEIVGTNATMIVTDQTLEILYKDGERKFYTYPELYNGSFMDIGGLLYSKQIEELLDYYISNKKPLNTIENSLYVQNIVELMYQSAKNDGKILKVEK